MIQTKSAYDPVEPSDGKRFLVTRYWPRGMSKEKLKLSGWIRELAPSKKLLHNWRNNSISWQEYELRYFQEMKKQQQCMQKVADLAASGTITLLCFEKESNPCCHRHLLKNLLNNLINSDI